MANSKPTVEPRNLKGFRDTFSQDFLIRQDLIAKISQTLQLFGFSPLETPVLEYAEILMGKLGDEGEKLLYQFKDHGNRQVAMRYDFTVPLARVSAQYSQLPQPFKRYQVGPVWRADNTQRGRYREFYQFDFDIVGSNTALSDAETLVVMQQIFDNLGVDDYVIRVNDRTYLESIARNTQLPDTLTSPFYAGLDKWEKIGGIDGVSDFWQQHGIDSSLTKALISELNYLDETDHPVAATIELAESLGLNRQNIQIDPTIVRGLDYYTGIVFETTLKQAPEFGSVFSGGRYDNLIGRFAKQEIPAVGASVGLDRLIAALSSLDLLKPIDASADVLVTVFGDEFQDQSLELTKLLRQSGIKSEIWLKNAGNLGKQIKYAAERNIPYVAIIGPDEAAQSLVTLRNLNDRSEVKVELGKAAEGLRESVGRRV